jgi:hypothetical protein
MRKKERPLAYFLLFTTLVLQRQTSLGQSAGYLSGRANWRCLSFRWKHMKAVVGCLDRRICAEGLVENEPSHFEFTCWLQYASCSELLNRAFGNEATGLLSVLLWHRVTVSTCRYPGHAGSNALQAPQLMVRERRLPDCRGRIAVAIYSGISRASFLCDWIRAT